MNSRQPAPELQRCISDVLARPRPADRGPRTGSIICAGVAALALSPLPATALTLGELATGSRLGQPLRATIPVRLAPGETINDRCVTRGGDSRELQGPENLRFGVPTAQGPGNFEIAVTTARPMVEPMYEISVRIDCQGTPRLLRHYVLMLDLPGLAPLLDTREQRPARTLMQGDRPTAAATTQPSGNPTPSPRIARSRDPIAPGSSYRVRRGDTLSTIADRIDGRPANSTWQLADQIFASNPSAFIRNNPNLIKLGHEIRIPQLGPAIGPSANPAPALAGAPATAAPESTIPPAPRLPSAAALPGIASNSPAQTSEPAIEIDQAQAAARPADPAAASARAPATPPELREPFAPAEALAEENAPVAAPAAETTPAPVVITESRSAQVSPILAVLLGILLGVALSLGLLRARVLERASELLRRDQRGAAGKAADGSFVDTDEWLDPTDTEVGALPVRAPAEETYVVEVGAPEPSEILEAEPTGDAFDPEAIPAAERTAADGLPIPAADAPEAELSDIEPSAEFADVFTDAMDGLPSEPDLPLDDPFAGTAETVEQPAVGPTAELPHFNSSGLGFDEDAETEELASLEGDGFEDADLGDLESAAGDETRLSSTLKEALSLLEQDYDEELTASQVIDQKAIEDALSDEEAAELQRKLGS